MPRTNMAAQIDADDIDLSDIEGLSAEEYAQLWMAESSPAGIQARINLEAEGGEKVTLKGTKKERTWSHTEFTPTGPVYFWDGQAKATPEQIADLKKRNRIK